ncbi:hypothetical protein FE391_26065 [Nonomuraea sp. KC401]|uniref:hypothetical protein n=1 Tax=unclassified Nonomuraea TaxID=2593643 RepID=UPI0010FE344E|nr:MULTISPECIES: hypothetical protein [unclassified Nonomuraea]NBE97218.1 hypothetical protein [Nonomuraea sp. K271]TLF65919.1 hypothetical protein FE391_26065 [Nonomuraea sp. KC401]
MALLTDSGPARDTLLDLARTDLSRAGADAQQDLEILAMCIRPGTTTMAATPLPVPDTDREDLDEPIRRAGWLDICAATTPSPPPASNKP